MIIYFYVLYIFIYFIYNTVLILLHFFIHKHFFLYPDLLNYFKFKGLVRKIKNVDKISYNTY